MDMAQPISDVNSYHSIAEADDSMVNQEVHGD
jgi:hypothetical protein